ncbi:MAG: AarF/ABC1/UbiB kinase family protein [Limnothrix sp. CACIAM 69d]|nr:MAG: AarF/ABC1/UbiB kinase family protein [Limnothrix sp. CACIAM 69d]
MIQPDLIPIPLELPPEQRLLPVNDLSFLKNRIVLVLYEVSRLTLKYSLKNAMGAANLKTELARDIRFSIEKLGGLLIKVGQLLSLRLDLFPAEICQELSKLQDRSYGFSLDYVRQIIQEELGLPLERIFIEFEERPFAAASISQVHRARIPSFPGVVAVKVQRPDVEEKFGQDLQLIRFLLSLIKKLKLQSYVDWDNISLELDQMIQEEIDYRYESSNLERMTETLREHNIYVPAVIGDYSTKKVLTMEYIPGILMSDYIRAASTDPEYLEKILRLNNIDPKLVGKRLFESFFRQMLEDNLFHGDLHPGNVMLLRDSHICLIDLGAIGSLDSHFLRYYRRSMQALGERDYDRALDYSLMLCDSLPAGDIENVKTQLTQCYRQWDAKMNIRSLSYNEKSIGSIGVQIGTVMRKNRISSSWQLLRVFRTWGLMDASLNYLIPNADYMSLVGGYFRGAVKRSQLQLKQLGINGIVMQLTEKVAELSDLTTIELRSKAVRKKTVVDQKTSSKLADKAKKLIWLALIVLAWVFLHQHLEIAVSWLPPNQYSAWAKSIPDLAIEVWVGILIFWVYLLKIL